MPPRRPRLLYVALALALFGSFACATKPAEPSGFLAEDQKMGEQDLYPFQRAWFAEGWNDPARSSIVIAPVNTQYVKQTEWWKKAEEEGKLEDLARDLDDLALFTEEQFEKAFREDENKRFAVLDSPQTGSVVMELAIVDVEPNKAKLGALGLAATLLAAPFGVAIAAKEAAKGGVAIEGRLKDAQSGQVIAMFADRERGKFAPISVARATSFGEIQRSLREWAEQWVKIANAPPGEKVKDVKPFTLRPW
jgi:hypothetical protein